MFLPRYDRFGWDYSGLNPPDPRAIAWYLRHARETEGPVLEIPCGTGPILAALARDGHEVVGVDLSSTMLELAGRQVAALAPADAARVKLVQGDMRDFDLGRTFGLAIVADNSLREVETLDAIAACLRRLRAHLRPEGRLLVTERRFDPSRFEGGVAEWPWSEPTLHPETGDRVQRRIRIEIDEDGARKRGVMAYRTTSTDGTQTTEEFPFEGPILHPADYHQLFADAGFTAQLFVGYEEREDDREDPMLCFVARPA